MPRATGGKLPGIMFLPSVYSMLISSVAAKDGLAARHPRARSPRRASMASVRLIPSAVAAPARAAMVKQLSATPA
jgi:hypothetical protein